MFSGVFDLTKVSGLDSRARSCCKVEFLHFVFYKNQNLFEGQLCLKWVVDQITLDRSFCKMILVGEGLSKIGIDFSTFYLARMYFDKKCRYLLYTPTIVLKLIIV